jgi:2-keto-myo-inositol isomerase
MKATLRRRLSMKLSYNEATTLENSNLATDLELCERHGYDYIEIQTMEKLPEYLEENSLDDLSNFFNNHHIEPLALNSLVYFNNRSDEDYQLLIKEFKQMLDYAEKLHIPYIVVVPLVTEEKILKKRYKSEQYGCTKRIS